MSASAYVTADNEMVQLDTKAAPETVLTPEDVQDPEKLSRELQQVKKDLAELKRRWAPRRMTVRDVPVTTLGTNRIDHLWGARVNWWVVSWVPDVSGTGFAFELHPDTDENTLVLFSGQDGTATFLLEEAG